MRLLTVVALLAAGILAGTQLGKIAPLVGWYQRDIGFSLVMTGWFTAMIGLFVAAIALPAGWAIERIGARRAFAVSSLVMVAGGVALAWVQSPTAIMLARLVEGLGYLALVIAIPALLNAVPPPAWRAPALAVWGGFVAIGFAVGDFLALAMDATAAPRAFLLVAVLVFGAFALPAMLLLGRIGDAETGDERKKELSEGGIVATLTTPVLLVSLAFGLYVILSIGFFAFLPTFVADAGPRMAVTAGVVSLTVPIGNAIAGLVVRHGERAALWLGVAGFALTVLSAPAAFGAVSAPLATGAMILLAVAGGLTASALFAALPSVVPEKGSAAVAIGLVCQAGGIGTLVGPPLAAWLIGLSGWSGFGWFLAATAVFGALTVLPLLLRGAPAQQTGSRLQLR